MIAVWLLPTLGAPLAWGIAQGLVKQNIAEVPPARFCLYYALANAVVNVLFWAFAPSLLGDSRPDILALENRTFLTYGLVAYVLDGIAWIFYYQAIVSGPISTVGMLIAAYPSITVILGQFVLHESLATPQYLGVTLVIGGCLGLAYSADVPHVALDIEGSQTKTRWIPYAASALLIWGVNGLIIRRGYTLTGSSEYSLALCIAIAGMATLGVYGLLFGLKGAREKGGLKRALLPMLIMAIGGLFAAIAYKKGPVSIVTPLSGAYPMVTLGFAWVVLKERPTKLAWACILFILAGTVLTTHVRAAQHPPPESTQIAR